MTLYVHHTYTAGYVPMPLHAFLFLLVLASLCTPIAEKARELSFLGVIG